MWILKAVGAVGRWLWRVAPAAVAWVAASPISAIATAVGLLTGAAWLKRQPWAGARSLASVLGYSGQVLLSAGVGSWVGRKVVGMLLGKKTAGFLGSVFGFNLWKKLGVKGVPFGR